MAITSIKTGSSFTNLVKYNDFLGPNSAYIPSSYESIASFNPTSGSTITFSSIPSTYKHLQLRCLTMETLGNGYSLGIQFNGDNSAIYTTHSLYGTGSSAGATGASSVQNYVPFGYAQGLVATYPNVGIIDIIDYASSSKFKTVRAFFGANNNSTNGGIELTSAVYQTTSAITSITLDFPSTGVTGSSYALYGIKG